MDCSARATTITFFTGKKHSKRAVCNPGIVPVDSAATPRHQIFFHLYETHNHSSLETRQAMISPSLAIFLLLVLHFKLIQTDFPPSSPSYSSFTSLTQRFDFCYLHFAPPSTHHFTCSLLPFFQCRCHSLKDPLLYASLLFKTYAVFPLNI